MKHRNEQKAAVSYPSSENLSFRCHRCMWNLVAFDAIGGRTPDGAKVGGRGRILKGGAHLPVLSGAQITKSRNRIVRDFLCINTERRDDDKIDWLFCIDADMTFEPDILERLIAAAHPVERPIIGGLCFSFMLDNERKFWPTLYAWVAGSNTLRRLTTYPDDMLLPVAATGAACLLIHRTVLERMGEKYPEPWPWFAETPFFRTDGDGNRIPGSEDAYSEDITFCLRAQACGFPVFVHTGIKLGHVKEFEADEEAFIAESMALKAASVPALPTYVVIASRDRPEMLANLQEQLHGQATDVFVYHNDGDRSLHSMWNDGLERAQRAAQGPHNVAVLNDDVEVPNEFLARLELGLRQSADVWIAYPDERAALQNGTIAQLENYSYAGQTMTGWAFMLRGEAGLRFDEQFQWWYGDSDLEKQVREAGKRVVCVGGCSARHLHPMESSKDPDRLALAKEDEARFAAKWGIDPDSLWLAQHPEFGAEVTV